MALHVSDVCATIFTLYYEHTIVGYGSSSLQPRYMIGLYRKLLIFHPALCMYIFKECYIHV